MLPVGSDADGETLTRKTEVTRPSNVRVYQFHHIRVACRNDKISLYQLLQRVLLIPPLIESLVIEGGYGDKETFNSESR